MTGPTTLPPRRDTAWVAAYLGKTPLWVRENARQLGGVKVGRTWLFAEPDLAAALERMRDGDAPTAQPATPRLVRSSRAAIRSRAS